MDDLSEVNVLLKVLKRPVEVMKKNIRIRDPFHSDRRRLPFGSARSFIRMFFAEHIYVISLAFKPLLFSCLSCET